MGAWRASVAGSGRVVLVTGEAGIGKTRLVDEVTAGVSRDESVALVLQGGCAFGAGGAVAFHGFVPVLLALFGPGVLDGRERRPGQLADEAARALLDAATARPVLLVLEDLHWADPATMEMLDYLARGLRRAPVMTVATARVDEAEVPAAVGTALGELARLPHAVTVELGRLKPDGVVEQVRALLGHPPEAALAARIVARSEGVPFYVEELVANETVGRAGPPAEVGQLLRQRTSGLPAPATAVLRAVAVAGTSVDEPMLRAATGLAAAELRAACRELRQVGLLVVDQHSGGYRLRHALLREAVERDVLPGEAAELHAAYARLLDQRVGDPAAAMAAAEHWWQAGDEQRAFDAAMAAAGHAHDLGAVADELRLRLRALELGERVSIAMDISTLAEQAGLAAMFAGDFEHSLELLGLAITTLPSPVEPARRARLLDLQAFLVQELGELPEVHAAIQKALAELLPGRSAARSYLCQALLTVSPEHRRGGPDRTSILLDALDGPLDELIPSMRVALRGEYAVHLAALGEADAALEVFRSIREETRTSGSSDLERGWLNQEADFLLTLGRPAEAEALIDRAFALAPEGSGPAPPYWTGTYVQVLLDTDRPDQAKAVLEDALSIDDPSVGHAGLYICLAQTCLRLDDSAGARAAAAEAHARLPASCVDDQWVAPLATVDAELALRAGSKDAALRLASGCLERCGEAVPPYLLWPLLGVAARAAAPRSPGWLARAIDRQDARHPHISGRAEAVRALLTRPGSGAVERSATDLTEREMEVLRLVAAGRSNPQIGSALYMSPKTASVHVSRILTKLGAASRGEAVAAALRRGIISTDDLEETANADTVPN